MSLEYREGERKNLLFSIYFYLENKDPESAGILINIAKAFSSYNSVRIQIKMQGGTGVISLFKCSCYFYQCDTCFESKWKLRGFVELVLLFACLAACSIYNLPSL